MNLEDNKKAAGVILRSLLSAPKMQGPQMTELGNWHQLDGNCQTGESYQTQEPIILQMGSNDTDRKRFVSNNENVIHRIPMTYLSTNNGNLTYVNGRTVPKPETFHIRRDPIPVSSHYCTIDENEANLIMNEPQKIVLVQDASSNIPERELDEVFAAPPRSTVPPPSARASCHFLPMGNIENKKTVPFNSSCHSVGSQSDNHDEISETIDKLILNNATTNQKTVESNEGLSTEFKKMEDFEEPTSVTKPKVKKKILGSKKNLKKRKNSKLKRKLKTGGKPLVKKRKKNVAGVECEKGEDEENGKKSRRHYFELTKLEDNVEQVVERFKNGCECSGSNCFDGLNPESIFKHRLNLADLTKAEHDMYLMGVIVSIQNQEETCRRKERIRIRSCYSYMGRKVCLTAFLYLQHVTLYQIKRLRSHIKNHGVSPRIHGNHGRAPANTLSLDIYRRATSFVQSYIEKHCVKSVPNFTTFSSNKIGSNSISGSNVSLHESKPGKKGVKVKIANKMTSYYLPSECTKKTVHKEYKIFCESLKPSQKVMKYSTFTNFLNKQFPNVKFQKVDKKQEEKSNGRQQGENSGAVHAPTVVYIPPKMVSQPSTTEARTTATATTPTGTLLVTPKRNQETYDKVCPRPVGSSVENSQIVVNGQHLQFYSGGSGNEFQTDFRFPNQVLVGSQIYSAQCVSQTSGTSQQIYAVDNIV